MAAPASSIDRQKSCTRAILKAVVPHAGTIHDAVIASKSRGL